MYALYFYVLLFYLYFHFVLILIFCEMDIQRYIWRKDVFDEVDELPNLKKKTGAYKVVASHHGRDAGANENTGVQQFKTLLLVSTVLSRLVKITHE